MTDKRCDIELIDTRDDHGDGLPFIAPNLILINGQEVLIPADSQIIVGTITEMEPVTVTITLFASSLRIGPKQ